MSSIWFVTGSTSGLGAALVNHLVANGDKVIAAGRRIEERLGHLASKSANIKLLEFDITAPPSVIKSKVEEAWNFFGHIDVLMNNAGMSAMKSAEDAEPNFIDNMFQVNLFGHMNVTQAMLPFFRAQGSGRIAFTSSSTISAPLPFMSHYAASKAALSAYVESLHKEVLPLGIRCVAFECGGFPTQLGQPRTSSKDDAGFGAAGPAIDAYKPLFMELVGKFATEPMAHMPGDPAAAARAMVDVVERRGLAAGRPWVVRVPLGSDGLGSMKQKCEEMGKIVKDWADVSASTDRPGQELVDPEEMIKFTSILGKA